MLDCPEEHPAAFGTGTVKPPPLTDADLAAMWQRAELIEDQAIKTDLFRLLTAVEALTNTFDAFAKGKK